MKATTLLYIFDFVAIVGYFFILNNDTGSSIILEKFFRGAMVITLLHILYMSYKIDKKEKK